MNSLAKLTQGNMKAAAKAADAVKRDLLMIPRAQLIVLDGFNVRQESPEYLEHVEAIAQSILTEGFYQDKPLAGFVQKQDDRDVIVITDGHTRLRAVDIAISRGAAIERLPVIMKPQGTNIEDLTVALVRSNAGKPLTPYETGLVCKRLLSYGLDEAEVGRRLGFTTGRVNDLLTLIGAAPEIRQMVVAGEVSATQAIKTMKTAGTKAAAKLTEGLKAAKAAGKAKVTAKTLEKASGTPEVRAQPTRDGGLTVRLTEVMVVELERAIADNKAPALAGLREMLAKHLKLEVAA